MSEMTYTPDTHDITTVNGIPRQVVCAANYYEACGTIVLGVRHFCPLMRQNIAAHGIAPSSPHKQGFVDQWGNFMSRQEAMHVISTNGRFLREKEINGTIIFSEDIY